MRVYFRNKEGHFCTKAQFCAEERSVTIPSVTYNFLKAEKCLEEMLAVDLTLAAQICAVKEKTSRGSVYYLVAKPSGDVDYVSSYEENYDSAIPLFEAFARCLEYRIAKQRAIVADMQAMSSDVLINFLKKCL